MKGCIGGVNGDFLILLSPGGGQEVNRHVSGTLGDTGGSMFCTRFRNRYSGGTVTSTRSVTCRRNYSTVVNMNKNGTLSATGTITAGLNSLPAVVVPAVTSGSTPYDDMTIVCGRRNIIVGTLVVGRGPSLILISAKVVTRTPGGCLISNVKSTLSACFRTHTYRHDKTGAVTHKTYSTATLTLTTLYCGALLGSSLRTLGTIRGRRMGSTLRQIVRTYICLDNIKFRSKNLTTTRTVGSNFTRIPRTRKTSRNRGITFKLLTRLVLRGTPGSR